MERIVERAATDLISPMMLFYMVGFAAAIAGAEITIPEAVAKGLPVCLLPAIGFKGGRASSANYSGFVTPGRREPLESHRFNLRH